MPRANTLDFMSLSTKSSTAMRGVRSVLILGPKKEGLMDLRTGVELIDTARDCLKPRKTRELLNWLFDEKQSKFHRFFLRRFGLISRSGQHPFWGTDEALKQAKMLLCSVVHDIENGRPLDKSLRGELDGLARNFGALLRETNNTASLLMHGETPNWASDSRF